MLTFWRRAAAVSNARVLAGHDTFSVHGLPPSSHAGAYVVVRRHSSVKAPHPAASTKPARRRTRTPTKKKTAPPVAAARSKLLSDTLGYDLDKVDDLFDRISGKHAEAERPGRLPSTQSASSDFFPSTAPIEPVQPKGTRTTRDVPSAEPSRVPPPTPPPSTEAPPVSADEEEAIARRVDTMFVAVRHGEQTVVSFDAILGTDRTTCTPVQRAQQWTLIGARWTALLKTMPGTEAGWDRITVSTVQLLTRLVDVVNAGLTAALATPFPSDLVVALKHTVDVLDALWVQIGVPAAVTPSAATDEYLNHRTTFSSLNYLLRFQWQQLSRATSSPTPAIAELTLGRAGERWMRDPAEATPLVVALDCATTLSAKVSASFGASTVHTGMDSTAASGFRRDITLPLAALLARTLLDVETHLSIARASVCDEPWLIPARLDRQSTRPATSGVTAKPDGAVSSTTAAESKEGAASGGTAELWTASQALCLRARVSAVQAVHSVVLDSVTRLTRLCGSDHDNVEVSTQASLEYHTVRRLVSMVKHALHAVLRRHYLETSANAAYTARHVTARREHELAVYTYALHTFLLLRDAHESVEVAKSPAPQARHGKAARKGTFTCGTVLSQALDTSFFLHLYVGNRWFETSTLAGDAEADTLGEVSHIAPLITPSRVDQYIKEVLCDLQHNTAKQLWHWRSKDELHYFSGLRRDGTFTRNDLLRRRHAQSVLGVVHAHVLHPSLLWMPLWQLQELVTILGERPHLLGTTTAVPPPTTTTADDDATPAHEAMTVHQYPLLHVGSRTVTLTRLHCYLVLRLFVVSNVLRACRSQLLDASTETVPHGAPLSQHAAKRLRASAAHEPSVEPQRRQQRDWTAQTVSVLLRVYPTLAAEVEGVANTDEGHARALARLESTVRYTLDRHLFIKAADLLQAYQSERRRDRAGGAADDAASAVTGEAAESGLLDELASVQLGDDQEPPVEPTLTDRPPSTQSPKVHVAMPSEPVALPATLVLRWSRDTVSMPLGFSVAADGCVLRVTPDGAFHRAMQTALSAPDVAETALLGWRVERVNGQAVADGHALAAALKKERQFLICLRKPVAARKRDITQF